MTSTQIRNHGDGLLDIWKRHVASCAEELGKSTIQGGLRHHFRHDLRVYGLCLTSARERLDHARGITNRKREEAWNDYIAAQEREREIFDEGKDGAVIGSVSVGFPTVPAPWERRLEEAAQAADAAMIRLCAT